MQACLFGVTGNLNRPKEVTNQIMASRRVCRDYRGLYSAKLGLRLIHVGCTCLYLFKFIHSRAAGSLYLWDDGRLDIARLPISQCLHLPYRGV